MCSSFSQLLIAAIDRLQSFFAYVIVLVVELLLVCNCCATDLREAMEAIEAEKQDEDRLSGPSRKTSSSPPTIEDTLATLIVKLEEKRQAASRPESLSVGWGLGSFTVTSLFFRESYS